MKQHPTDNNGWPITMDGWIARYHQLVTSFTHKAHWTFAADLETVCRRLEMLYMHITADSASRSTKQNVHWWMMDYFKGQSEMWHTKMCVLIDLPGADRW